MDPTSRRENSSQWGITSYYDYNEGHFHYSYSASLRTRVREPLDEVGKRIQQRENRRYARAQRPPAVLQALALSASLVLSAIVSGMISPTVTALLESLSSGAHIAAPQGFVVTLIAVIATFLTLFGCTWMTIFTVNHWLKRWTWKPLTVEEQRTLAEERAEHARLLRGGATTPQTEERFDEAVVVVAGSIWPGSYFNQFHHVEVKRRPQSAYDPVGLPDSGRFVGRKKERRWLSQQLRVRHRTHSTTLVGIGGIGKTALASIVIGDLYEQGHFPNGVAVVDCETQPDAVTILRTILGRFYPWLHLPQDDVQALLRLASEESFHQDALVVLVNAHLQQSPRRGRKPPVGLFSTGTVEEVLLAARMRVLVTTEREPAILSSLSGGHRRIRPLEPKYGYELFEYLFCEAAGERHGFSPSQRAAGAQIVCVLGGHPLAIRLAATYAARQRPSLQAFAKELTADARPILEYENGAVKHILTRSLERLPREAKQLFSILGVLASPTACRHTVLKVAKAVGIHAPERHLDALREWSLVEVGATPDDLVPIEFRDRVGLHPLLRAVASQSLVQRGPEAETATLKALAVYYANYLDERNTPAFAPEERLVRGVVQWVHEHQQHELSLLATLCYKYWACFRHTDTALQFLPWGIAAAETSMRSVGGREDRLLLASLLLAHAQALESAQNFIAAEDQCRQTLQVLGESGRQEGEAAVYRCLSRIMAARGSLHEGVSYMERAVAIYHAMGEREGKANGLVELASLLIAQKSLDHADIALQEALALYEGLEDRIGQRAALRHQLTLALNDRQISRTPRILWRLWQLRHID